MAHEDAVEALAGEITALRDRLDDLIYDVLREAVEQGAAERPQLERRLIRARNALGRAQALLRGAESETAEEA